MQQKQRIAPLYTLKWYPYDGKIHILYILIKLLNLQKLRSTHKNLGKNKQTLQNIWCLCVIVYEWMNEWMIVCECDFVRQKKATDKSPSAFIQQ